MSYRTPASLAASTIFLAPRFAHQACKEPSRPATRPIRRSPFPLVRLLFLALLCSVLAFTAAAQPNPDIEAIRQLIDKYAKAVDTVDLNLLSEIWSHSPEVSFIYPLGEEHGFEAIQEHVFQNVMGAMFSTRDLTLSEVAIHLNGNSAWSEFHWLFHATLRKDGSTVTTRGVETQIYRNESGKWRLVHVHYSEEGQP